MSYNFTFIPCLLFSLFLIMVLKPLVTLIVLSLQEHAYTFASHSGHAILTSSHSYVGLRILGSGLGMDMLFVLLPPFSLLLTKLVSVSKIILAAVAFVAFVVTGVLSTLHSLLMILNSFHITHLLKIQLVYVSNACIRGPKGSDAPRNHGKSQNTYFWDCSERTCSSCIFCGNVHTICR